MTDVTIGFDDRARDRHRRARPAAQHGAQPPPDHRRRADGPRRRLAGAGRGPRGRRRRDPDPRIPYRSTRSPTAIKGRARRARTSASSPSPRARGVEDARRARRREGRAGQATAADGARGREGRGRAARCAARRQHAAAGPPAGAADRSRVTGLDPRLHPAGRHAVARRSAARDAAGHAAADLCRRGRSGSWSRLAATRPRPCRSTEVAGQRKRVPPDHPWIAAARQVGTCLGTEDPQPNASVRFAGLCYGVPGRSRGWVARTPMSTRFEPFRSMNATSRGLSQPAAC